MRQVRLRAMEPEDLEMLYTIENDPELWGVGCTNVPYSRYVLHDYIAQSSGDIYTDRQVRLIIEDHQQEIIGVADLLNFDPKHRRAEVGIVIIGKRRRQGNASDALAALHDYAREVLHIHQLYAFIAADNEPSLALFRKFDYHISQPLADWLYDGKAYHPAFIVQKLL